MSNYVPIRNVSWPISKYNKRKTMHSYLTLFQLEREGLQGRPNEKSYNSWTNAVVQCPSHNWWLPWNLIEYLVIKKFQIIRLYVKSQDLFRISSKLKLCSFVSSPCLLKKGQLNIQFLAIEINIFWSFSIERVIVKVLGGSYLLCEHSKSSGWKGCCEGLLDLWRAVLFLISLRNS